MSEKAGVEKQLSELADHLVGLQKRPVPAEMTQASAAYAPLAALLAVVQFLEKQSAFEDITPGHRPTDALWDLLIAVSDLGSGVAHPMLTPSKPGKRTTATERQALQAWAAITCDCMQKAGVNRTSAGKQVANELRAVRLTRGTERTEVTGGTVLAWLDTMRQRTAQPGALHAWGIYVKRRKAEPATMPQEWVDRALDAMRKFVAGRPILVIPPAKVED